ncbi:transposase-like protein [Bacillus sp. RC55]
MLEERGLSISHTTIMRWVHQYGPELDKRIRRHLKQTTLGESMKHISK